MEGKWEKDAYWADLRRGEDTMEALREAWQRNGDVPPDVLFGTYDTKDGKILSVVIPGVKDADRPEGPYTLNESYGMMVFGMGGPVPDMNEWRDAVICDALTDWSRFQKTTDPDELEIDIGVAGSLVNPKRYSQKMPVCMEADVNYARDMLGVMSAARKWGDRYPVAGSSKATYMAAVPPNAMAEESWHIGVEADVGLEATIGTTNDQGTTVTKRDARIARAESVAHDLDHMYLMSLDGMEPDGLVPRANWATGTGLGRAFTANMAQRAGRVLVPSADRKEVRARVEKDVAATIRSGDVAYVRDRMWWAADKLGGKDPGPEPVRTRKPRPGEPSVPCASPVGQTVSSTAQPDVEFGQ